jgi:ATP-dependent protease ClpP protease subunit
LDTRTWRAGVRAALTAANTKLARQSWYRVVDAANDTAEVYVYDEIGMWGQSAADFVRDLSAVSARTVNVYVNSPGGEIFDGIAMYNALKSHPANVTVYVDSLAASIASVICMAGDKVIMRQGSQMMIHDGEGMCWGNAAEMTAMATLLDRQSDNIAGFYAARAGGKVKAWRDLMRAETWYSAKEAVAAGLADELDPTGTAGASAGTDMGNTWDLSVFKFAGREQAPEPTLVDCAFPGTTETDRSAAPVVESAELDSAARVEDDFAWTDDLADVVRAGLADEPDDEIVAILREAGLKPPPDDDDWTLVIDPSEFFNAVREGSQ